MINVNVLNSSDKPIYQQLFDQISSQIIKGELKAGFCLPPIRTAAKDMRISIITVKKAWEELERQGFIYAMVGRGCFVADLTINELSQMRKDIVSSKMLKDIEYYKEQGLSLSDIIKLIKSLY